jgi:hypothetical protein
LARPLDFNRVGASISASACSVFRSKAALLAAKAALLAAKAALLAAKAALLAAKTALLAAKTVGQRASGQHLPTGRETRHRGRRQGQGGDRARSPGWRRDSVR